MGQKHRKRTIRQKLYARLLPIFLILYLVLTGLFIVVIGIYYSNLEKISINEQSIIVADTINSSFEAAEDCAMNLLSDFNMDSNRGLLLKKADDRLEEYINTKNIQQLLYSRLLSCPSIETIAVCNPEYKLYATDKKAADFWNAKAVSKIQETVSQSGNRSVWFPIERRDYLTHSMEELSFTMGKNLMDIDTNESIGYLYIILKESTIASLYKEFETEDSHYFIVNRSGEIVSASAKELLLESGFEEKLKDSPFQQYRAHGDNQNCLVTVRPLAYPGLSLINVHQNTYLKRASGALVLGSGSIFLIIFLILIINIHVLCKQFVSPLEYLAGYMQRVKLPSPMPVELNTDTSCDELDQLNFHFNKMLSQLQVTFDNLRRSEKKKREMELALLQNQIRPHFLYNALDAIYVLNSIQEYESASEATLALADFYRSTLACGMEIITLRQEIAIVQNYLIIQEFRFPGVFLVSFQVPPDFMDFTIPKLTIQPIIENSIQHGLKDKSKKLYITITAQDREDYIDLSVVDCKALGDALQAGTEFGFGLNNINARIRLYYGTECGVTAEYTADGKFVTTIKLRKKCMGEE